MIIVVSIGVAIGILSVIAGVMYLVLVNVLSVDAVGWLQELSERIVRRAAGLHLPDSHRHREEEWLAELRHYRNRPVTMLGIALRISRNAESAGTEARRTLDSTAERNEAKKPGVVAFVEDLAPYKLRRLWLVNGVHLALALAGRQARVPTINIGATGTREGARFVDALQAAIVAMLNDCGLGLVGDSQLAVSSGDMVSPSDLVARILCRFRRADLCPFFDDFDANIGAMARLSAATTSGVPASVVFVFDTLHELLMDLEAYEDYDLLAIGQLRLDEQRDLEGLQRYRSVLRGIFTHEEVGARVSEIERSWRGHRDVAAP